MTIRRIEFVGYTTACSIVFVHFLSQKLRLFSLHAFVRYDDTSLDQFSSSHRAAQSSFNVADYDW